MKKVSLKYCDEYQFEKVYTALQSTIEDLGGLNKYIQRGDKVLLKVNLLMKKRPEEATTTHPVFVEALAKILIDYGASVLIGDSPGGPFNKSMLRGIYTATGMEAVAQSTGAELNYNVGTTIRKNPNGVLLKRITAVDMLNDVDKVISVSKLKTHGMMIFTGAVKNMFGIIPGILKAEYHLNVPDYNDFANALVDICLCADPVLSFMDGIVGMEGDGPSAGTPRNVNVVIASDSPYHLDKVACHIIGLEPEKVYTVKACADRAMITLDLGDIQLLGDNLNSFCIDNYKIPKYLAVNPLQNKMPKFLSRWLRQHIQPRPYFHHDLCIGCKICAENCPAKVIQMNNENRPEVNLDPCIRCYCCQELCPKKAVSIYKPRLLRMLSGVNNSKEAKK